MKLHPISLEQFNLICHPPRILHNTWKMYVWQNLLTLFSKISISCQWISSNGTNEIRIFTTFLCNRISEKWVSEFIKLCPFSIFIVCSTVGSNCLTKMHGVISYLCEHKFSPNYRIPESYMWFWQRQQNYETLLPLSKFHAWKIDSHT